MDLALHINGMNELTFDEQRETNGGAIGCLVIAVVVVVIFAAGVYVGYKP
jgi:hypothetical protein